MELLLIFFNVVMLIVVMQQKFSSIGWCMLKYLRVKYPASYFQAVLKKAYIFGVAGLGGPSSECVSQLLLGAAVGRRCSEAGKLLLATCWLFLSMWVSPWDCWSVLTIWWLASLKANPRTKTETAVYLWPTLRSHEPTITSVFYCSYKPAPGHCGRGLFIG